MPSKHSRKDLTFAERREIIKRVESGEKQQKVARDFHVSRSTVTKLMLRKDEISKAFSVSGPHVLPQNNYLNVVRGSNVGYKASARLYLARCGCRAL